MKHRLDFRTSAQESYTIGRVRVIIEPGPLETPCHIWQGATGYGGYPCKGNGAGKVVRGHRWAYEQEYGAIPPDHDIHHLCGHRRCINPEHLEAIDRREHRRMHNREELAPAVADAAAKSRSLPIVKLGEDGRKVLTATCKRGHPWTPENTFMQKKGRTCRACERLRRIARRSQ